eukprot:gene2242-biopygen15515
MRARTRQTPRPCRPPARSPLPASSSLPCSRLDRRALGRYAPTRAPRGPGSPPTVPSPPHWSAHCVLRTGCLETSSFESEGSAPHQASPPPGSRTEATAAGGHRPAGCGWCRSLLRRAQHAGDGSVDGWMGGAVRGGGGREFSGFPGAHPGAQISASRRASAPTRRAARARGGGWDRRLVQLSNDGLGTPSRSFLVSGHFMPRFHSLCSAQKWSPMIRMASGSSLAFQGLPQITLVSFLSVRFAETEFAVAPQNWRDREQVGQVSQLFQGQRSSLKPAPVFSLRLVGWNSQNPAPAFFVKDSLLHNQAHCYVRIVSGNDSDRMCNCLVELRLCARAWAHAFEKGVPLMQTIGAQSACHRATQKQMLCADLCNANADVAQKLHEFPPCVQNRPQRKIRSHCTSVPAWLQSKNNRKKKRPTCTASPRGVCRRLRRQDPLEPGRSRRTPKDPGDPRERAFAGSGRSVFMAGRAWSSTSLERSEFDLPKEEVLGHARPAINTDRPEPAKPRSHRDPGDPSVGSLGSKGSSGGGLGGGGGFAPGRPGRPLPGRGRPADKRLPLAGMARAWRGPGAGVSRACPVRPTGTNESGRGSDVGRTRAGPGASWIYRGVQ